MKLLENTERLNNIKFLKKSEEELKKSINKEISFFFINSRVFINAIRVGYSKLRIIARKNPKKIRRKANIRF